MGNSDGERTADRRHDPPLRRHARLRPDVLDGGPHVVTQYRNFRDPWGLLLRMTRSGDRAARAALARIPLAAVATPLDWALQPFEARRIRSAPGSDAPLILIVGAPRSGTTLVYQVLAQHLPVAYFNNLSSLFPRSTITASRLFQRFLPSRTDGQHSYYGTTAGLAGPNDAFHVWNRWLGDDRYRTPQSLTDDGKADMRAFFSACFAAFGRPILNKNNRNTECVPLLAEVLPKAVFLEVRREPAFTAQSLLRARQHIQGSKHIGWGLGSRDSETRPGTTSYLEDICQQVYAIDQRLQAAKASVGRDRFVELSYEAFCSDPAEAVERVHQRVWGTACDGAALRRDLKRLRPANEVTIDPDEFRQIEQLIAERYGPTCPPVASRVNR